VSLFEYNRKNFLFDRKLRQETEYQIMDFRIRQAALWREDVKDIIGLTSVKMDTYLIVNAVQLGFCVMAFCEGRLAAGTPTWLIGCHTLCLGGAFMYLLMSVWFSMHASVTAKAYEVRLLTQHVRLPVPTWAQLEGARTYASTFEKVNATQMFRMPFLMGTQEQVLRSSQPIAPATEAGGGAVGGAAAEASPDIGVGSSGGGGRPAALPGGVADAVSIAEGGELAGQPVESADLWGLEAKGDGLYELDGTIRADPRNMRHLRLVHEALQYWQSYDGFARVSMSMGTNQLVTALAYYVIGYVLVSNRAVVACWLAVLLFMVIASALIRLDMSLTGFEYKTAVMLVTSGPMLCAVAAQQWMMQTKSSLEMVNVLTPIVYISQSFWLMFLLYVCKVSEQKGGAMLPTGFRSVMYIDIFGWIRSLKPTARRASIGGPVGPSTVGKTNVQAPAAPGAGPGVQAVRYDRGRPVPLRPEQLAGAASSIPEAIKREDFEPTTFVPRMMDDTEKELEAEERQQAESVGVLAHKRPGYIPWTIFFYATSLLIVLWSICGILVVCESLGMRNLLRVEPLISSEAEDWIETGNSLLQTEKIAHLSGGRLVPTRWPTSHAQPHSIACSDGVMVSVSRFSLYAAEMSRASAASGINFTMASPCESIEGEALRDVALSCQGKQDVGRDCRAFVLHRQGQLLSSCRLPALSTASALPGNASGSTDLNSAEPGHLTSLAMEWLGEGNPAAGVPQEEVDSFVLADGCADRQAGQCAFAETSTRRVVEVRSAEVGAEASQQSHAAAAKESDQPGWYPTRILQVPAGGAGWNKGGALRLVGSASEPYLATLRSDPGIGGARRHEHQTVQVLDPRSGDLLSNWVLPEGKRWSSMCSTGDSLYVLARSPEPQIWRFPLPAQLSKRTPKAGQNHSEPQGVVPSAAAPPARTALRKAQRSAQTRLVATADAV